MSEKTREAVASLQPVREKLNAATDEAAGTLEEFNEAVVQLGMGVEANVSLSEGPVYDNDNDYPVFDLHTLEHRRGPDGWGVYVCRYEADSRNPDGPHTLISETPAWRSSRDLKLKAVARLGDLVEAIRREAGSLIERAGSSPDDPGVKTGPALVRG